MLAVIATHNHDYFETMTLDPLTRLSRDRGIATLSRKWERAVVWVCHARP